MSPASLSKFPEFHITPTLLRLWVMWVVPFNIVEKFRELRSISEQMVITVIRYCRAAAKQYLSSSAEQSQPTDLDYGNMIAYSLVNKKTTLCVKDNKQWIKNAFLMRKLASLQNYLCALFDLFCLCIYKSTEILKQVLIKWIILDHATTALWKKKKTGKLGHVL